MATPTNGNHRIFGTPSADFIDALDGNGADVPRGGICNNRLIGGARIDQLWRRADSDRFVLYNTAADRGVIHDWQGGVDQIEIAAALFGGWLQAGDSLDPSLLMLGTRAPLPGTGQFLFDTTNGVLRRDADGARGAAGQTNATLSGIRRCQSRIC